MSDAHRYEDHPVDRLTRIGDRMTDILTADPEYQAGDKAIVMLGNDSAREGGIAMIGYNDDAEAVADLLLHLKAIFEANGKEFQFMAVQRTLGNTLPSVPPFAIPPFTG